MTPQHLDLLNALRLRMMRPPFRGSVAAWCRENLKFDEPENHGRFRTSGCEYVVDVLEDFANRRVRDEVLVWGTQTRKTGTLMGGMAWSMVNDPCGCLWAMPNISLAMKFARQRWLGMLRASLPEDMIPSGAERHDFSSLSQKIGGSIVNFTGSNSAANLASFPCRRVILDEVDKFDEGGKREADAVDLAQQRTKDQAAPQRWKTSSPTLDVGLIWLEYLKGTQHRYFVPCPLCQKHVLLAWSPKFYTLVPTGLEAWVKWSGKTTKGWNLDQVVSSAHYVCPHCIGQFADEKKTWMVRNGVWKPTAANAPASFISRQLSSLYSTSSEQALGKLAVDFLQKKASFGLQGFINGNLAEPYVRQDKSRDRIELVTKAVPIQTDWLKIMTVDCQAIAPHFWYVIRAWNPKTGDSIGVEWGFRNTKEELEKKQVEHEIHNARVGIDSGWNTDNVYRMCAEHTQPMERQNLLPLLIGWIPMKGFTRKDFKSAGTGAKVSFTLGKVDPFHNSAERGTVELPLLEFSADHFADYLEDLRDGKSSGCKWSIQPEMDTSDYWREMDSHERDRKGHWEKKSERLNDEILDCERMQVVMASMLQFFNLETISAKY